MVGHKKALKILWKDTFTVSEYQKYTESDKSTAFREVIVLTNQPCKLSFNTTSPSTQTDTTDNITQSVKLFFDNIIKIKSGSKITVQRGDNTFEYKQSGEPAVFSGHQEISLVLFDGWA